MVRSVFPSSSHSKPTLVSVLSISQSAGTSNMVPKRGLATTFQPSTVAFAPSPPRGFSSAPDALGSAVGDSDFSTVGLADVFLSLPSSALSSLSPPSTRKPVTPAATTTARDATIATSFVRLPPPPPPPVAGCGTVAGCGVLHCCCPYAPGCCW